MKLASYIAEGKEAFGAVVAGGVITLNEQLGNRYSSLRHVLAANGVPEIKKATEAAKPDHAFAQIKWLPPIPNPEKILCAGINYRGHAAETGRDLPKQPSMFIRLANTLVGHEGDDYLGKVKVKVGPVTSEFSGKVRFVEQDRDQHRARGGQKRPEARPEDNLAVDPLERTLPAAPLRDHRDGKAVVGETLENLYLDPLDRDDPLRALRGQHHGEITTKVLDIVLERKGLHAVE